MFSKIKVFFVAFLLLSIAVPVNADFSDSFDNESHTNDNWITDINPSNTWETVIIDGTDLGFQGSGGSPGNPAVAVANKGAAYYNDNLSISVLIRMDSLAPEINGFFFSTNEVSPGVYNGYNAGIHYSQGDDAWSLILWDGIRSIPWYDTLSSALNQNDFYKMEVNFDTNINVYLYDIDDLVNPLGTVTNITPTLPDDSGYVGIFADSEATFNDFSVTGNTVPIPGAVWLLGSGFVGFVGLRRKLRK